MPQIPEELIHALMQMTGGRREDIKPNEAEKYEGGSKQLH